MTLSAKKPHITTDSRLEEIAAVAAMTRTARDNIKNLGMEFEAYLLDMAYIALSEHLHKPR